MPPIPHSSFPSERAARADRFVALRAAARCKSAPAQKICGQMQQTSHCFKCKKRTRSSGIRLPSSLIARFARVLGALYAVFFELSVAVQSADSEDERSTSLARDVV